MTEQEVLYTDDFEVLGMVGAGSFGKVYLIEHRVTHDQFARKDIDLTRMRAKEIKNAKQEIELMEKAKHPYILNIISAIETADYLYIFTEFCFGGDLKKFIKSVVDPQLPEQLIVCWLIQITEALQFLHDKRMLHRDIKPENIYLSDEGDIKLGDFGISRQLNLDESMATTFAGTPCYMSPEVLSQKSYNNKTDIWSLGCVIYELATSKRAFQVNTFSVLLLQVVTGKTPKIPDTYSKALVDLSCKMMLKESDSRPSASDILQDGFVVHFKKLGIKPMELISHLKTSSVVAGKVRQQENVCQVGRASGPFRMPVKYLSPLTESQRSQMSTSGTVSDSTDSTTTVTGYDTILARSDFSGKTKKNKTAKAMPDFETEDDDDSVLSTLMSTLTCSYDVTSTTQLATERRRDLIVDNIKKIQKVCAAGIGDKSLAEAYRMVEKAESAEDLEKQLKDLLKERYTIYQPYIMFLRILEALLET